MPGKNVHRPLFRNHKKPVVYVIVIMLILFLYSAGILQSFILSLHEFEYPGAFIAGLFYSYGMTTPFAIAVFAMMAGNMNPFLLAALGASGAVASDLLMLGAFSGEVGKELRITRKVSFRIPEAKSFPGRLALYLLGGFVLMSPLPDEVGVVILGISRIQAWKFAVLSFVSKFAGVLAIAGISLSLGIATS
ncbi:MAG: hypothetical protein AB1657_03345 [Candidatus Micrarchaeota archaeon]